MGKISSGCDIVFVINGNMEDAIRMGSDLSSEQSSYQAVAKILKEQPSIREALKERLKLETNTREVTKEELEATGIIPNCTVANIAKKYPELDWDNIDQSTKVLSIAWFKYHGQDMSDCIIEQTTPGGSKYKIIVVDTTDPSKVEKLNSYLHVQAKLRQYSDNTKAIVDNYNVQGIVSQLPVIKTMLEGKAEEFKKLRAKEEDETIKPSEKKKLAKLSQEMATYESLKEFTPKNSTELLRDFMDNSSKYQGLTFVIDGQSGSIATELNNVLREIEGKKVKEAIYQDIFANEIMSNSKYSPAKGLSYIRQNDFITALRVKQSDLMTKREAMQDKGSDAYKKSVELSKAINSFIERQNKEPKHWNEIVNLLIDQTDDEFSYSFDSMERGNIYLKNVPRTLEERYEDFTYKTLKVLKPTGQPHMGFTIYSAPDGSGFYYSRHVLTTKSYGKKYKTREECMQAINNSVQNNPLSQQSLIEFKTRGDRDVVYIPNKFLPGQVVKSLKMQFKASQQLNATEQELIYSTGQNNSNNLNRFYNYVMGVVDTKTPEYTKKNLMKVIDTAEKAACFIYALNEQEGTDREKIDSKTLEGLLNKIPNEYEYFVVESVGSSSNAGSQYGFKTYTSITKDGTKTKGTYKTLLTKIEPAEIQNSLVQTDENTRRPLPSIRLLNDLKSKLKEKLGIEVHVETQTSLEELFAEWGQQMPADVKGFVKNGEIYINSSSATDQDLFHEYTHLMLGVLKAKNFENYMDLVNLVANSDRVKYLKESMRNSYENLAEQDLNEEAFAEMFARYMAGRDLGVFLNGEMKDAKKAVDDKMGSIFGAQKISEDFYNASLTDVFRQFSHDLGQMMNEGNGLEITTGNSFRQASTWIEGQIKKYKESENGDIGIYEYDC